MPLYRGVRAEVRRVHRDAAWVVSGVVLGDRWSPADSHVRPPSVRLIEANLVGLRLLPDLIAPDDDRAVAVAVRLALDLPAPGPSEVEPVPPTLAVSPLTIGLDW